MGAGEAWWQRLSAECQRVAQGRLSGGLLIFLLFWMTAAASFSGSLGKWGLREREAGINIQAVLNGTAAKPLVYRRLIPDLVNAADRIVPDFLKQVFVGAWRPDAIFVRASAFSEPDLLFRYALICHVLLLSLFGSLFVLRQIALDAGADPSSATLAPIGLVLAYPYLQTHGGYFYDASELLLLAAAFRLAQTGQWIALISLTLPAALNKETFVVFIPTLYPLLSTRLTRQKALITIAGALLLGLGVNVWDHWEFIDAPLYRISDGGGWTAYFKPETYTTLEVTYGVRGPSGLFLGTCLATLIIILRGWSDCPQAIRSHMILMVLINLPLVVMAGAAGELRNFSFLFVGLVVLGALGSTVYQRAGVVARRRDHI